MRNRYKKPTTLAVALSTVFFISAANADLVAYWALDGNASDSVGNKQGTFVGSPGWDVGHMGQALLLDGVDDYVNCGNDPKFDITDEKFKEAAQLYQDIMARCGPEDDKGLFEYELCRCLFHDGKYREAVAKLKDYISANRATRRSLVKKGMLMKAHTHVQLGETDTAIDEFFAVMMDDPEAKEMPETDFFIGYCYMLQRNFDEAKEALDTVIQIHPDSDYASKAGICLARIKEINR